MNMWSHWMLTVPVRSIFRNFLVRCLLRTLRWLHVVFWIQSMRYYENLNGMAIRTSAPLSGIIRRYLWNSESSGKYARPRKKETSLGSVFLTNLLRWWFPSAVKVVWLRCLRWEGVCCHPGSVLKPGSGQTGQWTIKLPGCRC